MRYVSLCTVSNLYDSCTICMYHIANCLMIGFKFIYSSVELNVNLVVPIHCFCCNFGIQNLQLSSFHCVVCVHLWCSLSCYNVILALTGTYTYRLSEINLNNPICASFKENPLLTTARDALRTTSIFRFRILTNNLNFLSQSKHV
jgi:hypothetical protein